jgi:DNA-binding beta-propeller fold protein YncE
VDIVSTATYQVIKKIPVVSPFSPNIYTSPDGNWIAMTHKDVGKVTVISTATQAVTTVLNTGPITNHVTFFYLNKKLLMLVTVGGENKVRIFDVANNFKQTDTVIVGALPHGIWPSKDGKLVYVGLEYADQVQGINLETMKVLPPVEIGQSPQALVYADNAVTDVNDRSGLTPLNDTTATQVFTLKNTDGTKAIGRVAIRSIGLTELVEQIITGLKPGTSYTLALSRSGSTLYTADYEINSFSADTTGRYAGQSTGLIKTAGDTGAKAYKHVILIDNDTKQVELSSN